MVLRIPTHHRSRVLLCILACVGIGPNRLAAQSASTGESSAEKSEGLLRACGCPDGRRFALGASMFGRSSARVLITGFRSEAAANVRAGAVPRCSDLAVLGQVVELLQASDGRPFLKRDSLKRGTISSICDTQISFFEPKKSYDFFADDGSAVTLTDDGGPPVDSQPPVKATDPESEKGAEADENVDLTGQDLIRLLPAKAPANDPGNSPFDEQDLKEGAYFIVSKRCKAPTQNDGGSVSSTSQNRALEVTVPAGTLGRIEKQAGFRSEPTWVVELFPDSAPQPFWRSLLQKTRSFAGQRAVAGKVVLPSSHMVEINHFFDQYGVDWTYFGDQTDGNRRAQEAGTTHLPLLYSPAPPSLEENVAEAQKVHAAEAMEKATLGLRLVPKDRGILAKRTMLVLDESAGSGAGATPDLLHRQCFVGLGALKGERHAPNEAEKAGLRVVDADVKVFQPKNSQVVPADFYAIDLQFMLQPDSGTSKIPVVCRFPLAPIDTALVDSAARILSRQFEIEAQNRGER
jgi:hypothetical protein